MRPSLRLGLLVLATMIAGACGGGGDTASPAADRAAAENANLRAGDFPSGWSSKPHEKLPDEDTLNPDIAACLGISPPSGRATAEVRSADFTQAMASASSVITFVKTGDEATADAKAVTGGKFADCIKPGYEKQMHDVAPQPNSVSEVAVTKLDFPKFGQYSIATRVTGKVHIDELGIDVPVNVDVIRIFKGRAEAEIVVVAPGTSFPNELVSGLAGAVAGRL